MINELSEAERNRIIAKAKDSVRLLPYKNSFNSDLPPIQIQATETEEKLDQRKMGSEVSWREFGYNPHNQVAKLHQTSARLSPTSGQIWQLLIEAEGELAEMHVLAKNVSRSLVPIYVGHIRNALGLNSKNPHISNQRRKSGQKAGYYLVSCLLERTTDPSSKD